MCQIPHKRITSSTKLAQTSFVEVWMFSTALTNGYTDEKTFFKTLTSIVIKQLIF